MTRFRLATVNVHLFRNPSGFEGNLNDLVTILEPLDLDLIAVQEIQNNDKWKKFSSRLSLQHSFYGQCNGEILGNGIASRFPIQSPLNVRSISCAGEARSFLQCSLRGDHPFIRNRLFAVTHLDYLDEEVRLAQINEFNPHHRNVDVLVGDMNALTREDYSDQYFHERIVDKRERSQWENLVLI